jgi:hypothetical protein
MRIGKNVYLVKTFRYTEQFTHSNGTKGPGQLVRVKGYFDEDTPSDVSLKKLENAINRNINKNGRVPRWVAITELWLEDELVGSGLSACAATDRINKREGLTRALIRALKEAKLERHIETILQEQRRAREVTRKMARIQAAKELLQKYGETV